MNFDRTKIIVALSGGVDSAVSALLLKEQGFSVKAVFMLNWSETSAGCNWEWDYESAKLAARHLGIPLELWNFEEAYRKQVYEPFIESFERGETPNPDVICNRYVKFGVFLEKALHEGADWIATGHYASIEAGIRGSSRLVTTQNDAGSEFVYRLVAGKDTTKDQSYFLATLTQEQLKYTLLPLGTLTKTEVRAIARAVRLPNAARQDSYGICFVGEQDMAEWLRPRVRSSPGPIVTTDGKTVGTHEGLPFYTIGQRKGIGIGGTGPYYVVAKKVADNTLVVTANPHDPALYCDYAVVANMHWIGEAPKFPFHCLARHRHLQPLQNVTIESFRNIGIKVTFTQSQRAITPGQFLALYDEEICLGGGTIGYPILDKSLSRT